MATRNGAQLSTFGFWWQKNLGDCFFKAELMSLSQLDHNVTLENKQQQAQQAYYTKLNPEMCGKDSFKMGNFI